MSIWTHSLWTALSCFLIVVGSATLSVGWHWAAREADEELD